MNEPEVKKRLRDGADQCVKCGLCLPHCPTYRELRNEAESPRGRIALIQGWAEERIADSPSLQRHLGNCLECGACETACPSLVRFTDMMDEARALRNHSGPMPLRLVNRLLLWFLTSGSGARAAALLGRTYRVTGLARLSERIGLLRRPTLAAIHRLALQLGPRAKIRQNEPLRAAPRGEVALFLGCVGRVAQPGAIEAAQSVLERLGFAVVAPNGQVCCGAMHRHNGFPETADRLLARNAEALDDRAAVGIASACVAELRTRQGRGGSLDICRLLADLDWPEHLRLDPLPRRVAVHEPCSQRNMLRDARAAQDLLRRIPQVELIELPDNTSCCGAAGSYLLQRPRLSRSLLESKLTELEGLGASILVTSNTGCALHLAAGVRETGLAVEVLHPVELIARQLSSSSGDTGPSGCDRQPCADRDPERVCRISIRASMERTTGPQVPRSTLFCGFSKARSGQVPGARPKD